MSKRNVVYAFSAGGVVFQQAAASGGIEIALVGRAHDHVWALPKGTPHEGETREMTALREVREESGLETRIVGEVGAIEYVFTRKGRTVNKQVFHYLMIATGGALDAHDHEYDEARWFAYDEALRTLTYENERDIARRAAPLIRSWLAAHTDR
ncbi:MAG TPA: NUDIX hydrolase [Ktedonobacterales bacterium]